MNEDLDPEAIRVFLASSQLPSSPASQGAALDNFRPARSGHAALCDEREDQALRVSQEKFPGGSRRSAVWPVE